MTTKTQEQEMVFEKLMTGLFKAFRHFNDELFESTLGDCSIQIGVKKGARGVFKANEFYPKDIEAAVDGDTPKLHGILLNPNSFDRSELEVLSTLAHEMAHQWQAEQGTPGKGAYHNQEWAEFMKTIGLFPSNTGEPGGKQVGRKMTHYIVDGGPFDVSARAFLIDNEFSIDWYVPPPPESQPKTPRKVTYRCACPKPWYSNISGRKGMCLDCDQEFEEEVKDDANSQ